MAKGLINPLVFSEQLAKTTKRIDAATASLICDIEVIERAFKNLHARYILQEVSTPRILLTAKDSSAQCTAIDDTLSSFYRNPFNLSHTANVSVTTLFKLNQNREVAEEATKAMRAQGAQWAEDSDSSDRVEGLSRIQTRLME